MCSMYLCMGRSSLGIHPTQSILLQLEPSRCYVGFEPDAISVSPQTEIKVTENVGTVLFVNGQVGRECGSMVFLCF